MNEQEIIKNALDKSEQIAYASLLKLFNQGKLRGKDLEKFQQLIQKIEDYKDEQGIAEQQDKSKDVYLTTFQICRLLDIDRTQFFTWRSRGDFPTSAQIKRGIWNFTKVFRWWYEKYIKEDDKKIAQAEARRRREIAIAELKEMEALEKRGQLIHIEQVQEDISFVLQNMKNKLLMWQKSLPPRLKQLDERQIQKILNDETKYVLNELADSLKRMVVKKKEIKRR